MNKKINPHIKCDVQSCDFNTECCCSLSEIQVSPQEGCHSGKPCDESFCASYRCSDCK